MVNPGVVRMTDNSPAAMRETHRSCGHVTMEEGPPGFAMTTEYCGPCMALWDKHGDEAFAEMAGLHYDLKEARGERDAALARVKELEDALPRVCLTQTDATYCVRPYLHDGPCEMLSRDQHCPGCPTCMGSGP